MNNGFRIEIAFSNPLQIMDVPAPVIGGQILIIRFDNFAITLEGDHVMYNLPADHTVQMQVVYVDSKGNPATIDNAVVWDSSDVSIVSVQADAADSTKVKVTPVAVGQAQVTATVDADIGEGVRELKTLADINVVGGEAVAGMIAPVGEAEPMP
jgi:Bacterial Ig-like domain (group 2)